MHFDPLIRLCSLVGSTSRAAGSYEPWKTPDVTFISHDQTSEVLQPGKSLSIFQRRWYRFSRRLSWVGFFRFRRCGAMSSMP